MLTVMHSSTVFGVEGVPLEIEVLISNGPASFNIEGLPDNEGNRLQARVSEAVRNSGFHFPDTRITVRLAPADLADDDLAWDLAVATGILSISGQINSTEELEGAIFLGALLPDGNVRQTPGILPMLEMARKRHFRSAFIPAGNAVEAMLVEGISIYPVERLEQLVAHLNGERSIEPYRQTSFPGNGNEGNYCHDMAEVRGQEHVKRALEVAASGGHHILLSGAPGSGKRLLASTFPSILPSLTREEILEIARIYSVNGMLSRDFAHITQRPFRAPQHHISTEELIGEGSSQHPGVVSLAHQGVLFLDELSLFGSHGLEALSYSLEEKKLSLQWRQQLISYPARAFLIATMKPCPCGFLNDPIRECTCIASEREHYEKRIGGPLSACFDIFVEVPRIDHEKLVGKRQVETSADIRSRVQTARERQRERLKGTEFRYNAEISSDKVRLFCQLDPAAEKLLTSATQQVHLPLRSTGRIIRLAQTIADLAGSDLILANHVAEAIHYRPRVNFK
jgi:magnesium chelatase family protein